MTENGFYMKTGDCAEQTACSYNLRASITRLFLQHGEIVQERQQIFDAGPKSEGAGGIEWRLR